MRHKKQKKKLEKELHLQRYQMSQKSQFRAQRARETKIRKVSISNQGVQQINDGGGET